MSRFGARLRAFVVVTALAVGAGALLGVLSVGAYVGFALATGRALTGRDAVGITLFGALWGGVFGLALGPLTAFAFLRTVPLGRAVLGTAAGTILGIAATLVLGANPFVALPIGFLVGAVGVRVLHQRRAITDGAQGRPS